MCGHLFLVMLHSNAVSNNFRRMCFLDLRRMCFLGVVAYWYTVLKVTCCEQIVHEQWLSLHQSAWLLSVCIMILCLCAYVSASGGHKDEGVSLRTDKSNLLTDSSSAAVGTHWVVGGHLLDSTAYAVPKFASERMASTLAQAYPCKPLVVCMVCISMCVFISIIQQNFSRRSDLLLPLTQCLRFHSVLVLLIIFLQGMKLLSRRLSQNQFAFPSRSYFDNSGFLPACHMVCNSHSRHFFFQLPNFFCPAIA